jgi:hypothetical protein
MAQDQFDAREITVLVDGSEVAQLDTVGYDQGKEHELDRSLDEEGEDDVWIEGGGEYTGSVAVKAVSSAVPQMETLFQENTQFSITVNYAPSEPRSSSEFLSCMLTSFGPADDYDNDSMPMYEGEFEAAEVNHN